MLDSTADQPRIIGLGHARATTCAGYSTIQKPSTAFQVPLERRQARVSVPQPVPLIAKCHACTPWKETQSPRRPYSTERRHAAAHHTEPGGRGGTPHTHSAPPPAPSPAATERGSCGGSAGAPARAAAGRVARSVAAAGPAQLPHRPLPHDADRCRWPAALCCERCSTHART